jgi:hypothetical protein
LQNHSGKDSQGLTGGLGQDPSRDAREVGKDAEIRIRQRGNHAGGRTILKLRKSKTYAYDTSILISERAGDRHQEAAHALIEKSGVPILISRLYQLESNSVVCRLKGMNPIESMLADEILAEFEAHFRIGVLKIVEVHEHPLWTVRFRLGQLEEDGIVRREVDPELPPKVEYSLTDWCQPLCLVLDGLLKWAEGKKTV